MRHAAAEARARRRMKRLTMLLLFTCVRTSLPALLDETSLPALLDESTVSLHTETNVTETNVSDGRISDGRILFVNICRNSCGFCQALLPAWAQFARRMGTSARVGLWDADMPQPVPSLFGAVEATPTILALVPARNLGKGASSEGSHGDMGAEAAPGSQGTVQIVLYKGPRHTDALVDFAMMLLPDRVALLDSAERFRALTRVALNRSRPRVISFLNISSTAPTPPFLRALAADFRRRALFAQVRLLGSKSGAAARFARRLGVGALPALVVLPAPTERTKAKTPNSDLIWGDTEELAPIPFAEPPTYKRLSAFLRHHLGHTEIARSDADEVP